MTAVVSETPRAKATAHLNRKTPVLLIVSSPNDLMIDANALMELELCWEVVFAREASKVEEILAARATDVVLIDLDNPAIDGIELIGDIHRSKPRLSILAMSAPYGVSLALEACQKGAIGHFPRELLHREPEAVLDLLRSTARMHQRRESGCQRMRQMQINFILENDRRQVGPVVHRVQEAMLELGLCDRSQASRVGVALEECLLNAILHGNLEVSSELRQDGEEPFDRMVELRRIQTPYADRIVTLDVSISADEAIFVVEDQGPGFDINKVPDPTCDENLCRVGGRGILLIRSFMNEVIFNAKGNRITMKKRRDAER